MQNVRKQKEKEEEEIKFHFASTDIRYRHNRDAGKLEFVSTKGSKVEVTSEEDVTSAAAVTDSDYSTLSLPTVESTSHLPIRNQLTDIVAKRARDCLWTSPASPPSIETPSTLYLIRKEGDMFEDAVEKLLNSKEVGVSGQIEREDVARTGLLSLLSIATRSEVYVFDLDTIGPSVFKWGLGEVLTNPGCVKVVHDSRMLSDVLWQRGQELVNVFDTLAAHYVFARLLTDREVTSTKPLFSAVRDYLGVSKLHLPGRSEVPPGQSWLTRPLGEDQLLAAARETIFLLELRHLLQTGLDWQVRRATQVVLKSSRLADDQEVRQRRLMEHVVPSEMREIQLNSEK